MLGYIYNSLWILIHLWLLILMLHTHRVWILLFLIFWLWNWTMNLYNVWLPRPMPKYTLLKISLRCNCMSLTSIQWLIFGSWLTSCSCLLLTFWSMWYWGCYRYVIIISFVWKAIQHTAGRLNHVGYCFVVILLILIINL